MPNHTSNTDKPSQDAADAPNAIVTVPIRLTPDHPRTQKLTKARQQQFFQYLAEDFNITKAAAHVGVTRRAIEKKIASDERFRESLELVRDAFLDSAESAMFEVGRTPSREGFNDRKLALQSHRPETYAPRSDIRIDHQVTIQNALPELRRLLHSATPKQIDHTETE